MCLSIIHFSRFIFFFNPVNRRITTKRNKQTHNRLFYVGRVVKMLFVFVLLVLLLFLINQKWSVARENYDKIYLILRHWILWEKAKGNGWTTKKKKTLKMPELTTDTYTQLGIKFKTPFEMGRSHTRKDTHHGI